MDLGTLGGSSSQGLAISNAGKVTGFSATTAGNRAFVFTPGQGMTAVGDQTFFTSGRGINNRGQVALNSIPSSDVLANRGFVFTPPNQVTTLQLPGGAMSTANAINNAGQVTGLGQTFVEGQQVNHAYLYTPGTGMVDLFPSSPLISTGFGINNFGQVTGTQYDAANVQATAFIFTPGQGPTFFTANNGASTLAQAINDFGQVAGYFQTGSNLHAFVYTSGSGAVDIGAGRPGDSRAMAINNLGQVVGFTTSTFGEAAAFLYSEGTGIVDLNTLIPSNSGWRLTSADGINDQGQITGGGFINGEKHAFLLTPVDVPIYTGPSRFVPVTPCRVVDTRLRGPAIGGGSARRFPLIAGGCNLPFEATAFSLNVTVVPHEPLGYLTIWPSGKAQPFVSTLNSQDGRVKANAAIVPASPGGAVDVFASNTTDVVLDVNGYFVPVVGGENYSFYPVTPCRVADTRLGAGSIGGPALNAGESRTFSLTSPFCNIPATAKAYSVNFTVVPSGPLGYLTAWPSGAARPFVSTLNAPTGAITANAAIVPAGANATIDVFVTNTTDLILDVNGYFAPPSGPQAMSFYSLTPCRAADTRLQGGVLNGGEQREFAIRSGTCGEPGSATAYSLNATVVPRGSLAFLTLWPFGQFLPRASTLNAFDGAITSNASIVPAGTNGSISSYVTSATDLILDINGYFAP
jgi:probable HAF family extracellular repeat protein